MQYFNIQVASQLSGVASATIRAWEKRYHAVVPERAENKHRLYSETDIEKLAVLYKLTEFGQSIGKIAHLPLQELRDIYSRLMHRPYDERHVVTPHHDKIDYDKILGSITLALSAFKLDIVSHELEKAKKLLNPKELCLNLILPLFKKNLGEIQKNVLVSLLGYQMGELISGHYQKGSSREELILISNSEKINTLLAALLCVYHGFNFIPLGSHLPAELIAETAQELGASGLFLGIGSSDKGEDVKMLKEALNSRCELWVEGELSPTVREELEKKNVTCFPTFQAFDEFLSQY